VPRRSPRRMRLSAAIPIGPRPVSLPYWWVSRSSTYPTRSARTMAAPV